MPSSPMTDTSTDFDAPWKNILESYFPEFVSFFFSDAYRGINWERGYAFLDVVFPVVKLLDYSDRQSELETSRNPFATVVMAHLKTQRTRYDVSERKNNKQTLIRRLYERGYGREEVVNPFSSSAPHWLQQR